MMETSLIGEMDMHPNFSEVARRYGADRHTVVRYWKEGERMEDRRGSSATTWRRARLPTGCASTARS